MPSNYPYAQSQGGSMPMQTVYTVEAYNHKDGWHPIAPALTSSGLKQLLAQIASNPLWASTPIRVFLHNQLTNGGHYALGKDAYKFFLGS